MNENHPSIAPIFVKGGCFFWVGGFSCGGSGGRQILLVDTIRMWEHFCVIVWTMYIEQSLVYKCDHYKPEHKLRAWFSM